MGFALSLHTHRHWEDWLGIGLGILVMLAPWPFLATDTHAATMQYIMLNALVAGLLIACLSALEIKALAAWEEWVNLALGLWVAASPWVFGYAQINDLMLAHLVLGLMVIGLAALELWQDLHHPKAAE